MHSSSLSRYMIFNKLFNFSELGIIILPIYFSLKYIHLPSILALIVKYPPPHHHHNTLISTCFLQRPPSSPRLASNICGVSFLALPHPMVLGLNYLGRERGKDDSTLFISLFLFFFPFFLSLFPFTANIPLTSCLYLLSPFSHPSVIPQPTPIWCQSSSLSDVSKSSTTTLFLRPCRHPQSISCLICLRDLTI